MLTRIWLATPLLALALLAVDASEAQAQWGYCGSGCTMCVAPGSYQGFSINWPYGDYEKPCNFGSWCASCGFSLDENTLRAQDLVVDIESMSPSELGHLVASHGDRLLLNESRRLLAVTGNGCDPEALDSVVFLSEEQAQHLALLGVRDLAQFLAARAESADDGAALSAGSP